MEETKKKATAAHMKATAKFEKNAYFKTLARFNKADEPRIRAAAGESLNGFIVSAVLEKVAEHERTTTQERNEIVEVQRLIDQKKADREKVKKYDI